MEKYNKYRKKEGEEEEEIFTDYEPKDYYDEEDDPDRDKYIKCYDNVTGQDLLDIGLRYEPTGKEDD